MPSGQLKPRASAAHPLSAAVADRWGRLSPDQPLPVTDGLLAATAMEHKQRALGERGIESYTSDMLEADQHGLRRLFPADRRRRHVRSYQSLLQELARLQEKAGFWLTEAVRQRVLQLAGETE